MKYDFPDGTPIWADLSTTDLDGSKEFYKKLLGWETEERTDDDGNVVYHMFTKDGKVAAGLMSAMGETPTVWTTYFKTTDIDATVEKVKAAGGSCMVDPMPVMESGHMAVVSDDQGAVFGLWQPKEHKGADEYNKPGFNSWNELATKDMEQAKTFYGAVFGWGSEENDMGNGQKYTSFTIDGKTDVQDHYVGGGMVIMPIMGEVPPSWTVYVQVDDIDARIAAAKESGATCMVEKMSMETIGEFVLLRDPQGGMLYLIQPSSDS